MMFLGKRFSIASTAIALSALLLASCGRNKNATPVQVGLNFELTGDISTIGTSGKNAAALAFHLLDDSKDRPHLADKTPIQPLLRDNAANPTQAAEITQQFIMQDGVIGVIGPNSSACAIPSARVAEGLKTVLITPWASDAEATLDAATGVSKRYVFRICTTDLAQARIMAGFAWKNLSAKTAAVLYDITSNLARQQSEAFRDAFVEDGGKITAFEAYSPSDKDYALQLAVLKDASPDVIFLPAHSNEVPAITKQARDLQITAPFLGTEAWGANDLIAQAGAAVDGSYFCKQFSPLAETEETKQFVAKYEAAFGQVPDDVAALTYDACNILIAALNKSETPDREALRVNIAQIRAFPGVTGNISFEPGSGDPIKSAPIMQIKDGRSNWITNAE